MPDTSLGITYPASTSHTRIWEHLQALADDVNALLAGSGTTPIAPYAITNEAKISVTYQNGWIDWGSPWQGLKYWKDKNGVVHIDGLIKGGTTTAGTTIFTLPVGYRPSANLLFLTWANTQVARVDVEPTGAVKIGPGNPWSATLNSLSGITFKAEQ